MDARIAILGANGTGKSTLLNLITSALQPCQGTISKHTSLKLAKYSQHSADQLPYDKSPIEYFEGLFGMAYPDKDIMVREYDLFSSGYYDPTSVFLSSGDSNLVALVYRVLIRRLPSNNFLMVSETGTFLSFVT